MRGRDLLILALLVCFSLLGINLTNVQAFYHKPAPRPEPPAAKEEGSSVNIQGFSFNPKILTISEGTVVTWTNRDGVPHTVTSGSRRSSDGLFDSGSLAKGDTFSYKFNKAGSYEYFCPFHPGMEATIIVK